MFLQNSLAHHKLSAKLHLNLTAVPEDLCTYKITWGETSIHI